MFVLPRFSKDSRVSDLGFGHLSGSDVDFPMVFKGFRRISSAACVIWIHFGPCRAQKQGGRVNKISLFSGSRASEVGGG